MPHRWTSTGLVYAEADPQSADGAAAFVALTAFNGAALGAIGCIAASLTSDTALTLLAGCGTAVCAYIWKTHLIDGDA